MILHFPSHNYRIFPPSNDRIYRLLEQYLLELDITVYRIHVQERPKGMLKTDKRDALRLANMLYTQLELGPRSRTNCRWFDELLRPQELLLNPED